MSVEPEPKKKVKTEILTDSPYLSTIKRHLLDFDFEKVCSISLNNLNVYACLVCGKYYQGRAKGTYAYIHSLELDHHVFINLHTTQVYCLPDNYEIENQSLWDIKYNLRPHYTKQQLEALDSTPMCRGLDGTQFQPGFVGLNNLKNTDYVNVVIQGLCRVAPLRDFFIFYEFQQSEDYKTLLSKRFAELIRKIWNDKNFKGHVSPHELLQAISLRSNKQFRIGHQSDPINLLAWLLNNLEAELLGVSRKNSIISQCFRGQIEVQLFKPLRHSVGYEQEPEIETKPFMYLTLDIPPVPLHKDQSEKSLIPRILIYQLLSKFDGLTNKDSIDGRRRFRIKQFPRYLVLHMKRFMMNNFFMEKNPTIVQFPPNELDFVLDMTPYAHVEGDATYKYKLIASICHEGNAKVGVYKIHVRNLAKNIWYQLQDLHKVSIMPELISVAEAYIQIYELQ